MGSSDNQSGEPDAQYPSFRVCGLCLFPPALQDPLHDGLSAHSVTVKHLVAIEV